MLDDDSFATELDAALRAGEVFAVYQPLVEVASGRIAGVEGLCRWTDSRGRAVPPDMFIPIAENTGLIHELGRFMLDECLASAAAWRAAGNAIDISINVSPTQLADASFCVDVVERLVARALPADAVTLEITESLPSKTSPSSSLVSRNSAREASASPLTTSAPATPRPSSSNDCP